MRRGKATSLKKIPTITIRKEIQLILIVLVLVSMIMYIPFKHVKLTRMAPLVEITCLDKNNQPKTPAIEPLVQNTLKSFQALDKTNQIISYSKTMCSFESIGIGQVETFVVLRRDRDN